MTTIYGGSLWQSFDGYATAAGPVDIPIEVHGDGPHRLEIRNRAQKNQTSGGYKVRFKQLLVAGKTWTQHTVEYSYGNLVCLLEARYNPGLNIAAGDADQTSDHYFQAAG